MWPQGGLPFCGVLAAEVDTLRVVPAVGRRSAATTRADDVRAIAATAVNSSNHQARTTAARPVVFLRCAESRGQASKKYRPRGLPAVSDVALPVATLGSAKPAVAISDGAGGGAAPGAGVGPGLAVRSDRFMSQQDEAKCAIRMSLVCLVPLAVDSWGAGKCRSKLRSTLPVCGKNLIT